MDQRFSKGLAAAAVGALLLLSGCGGSSTPAGSSATPATTQPAAPVSTSGPGATPSVSAKPSDETENVQAAGKTFVKTIFGYDSSESYAQYQDRIEPLMTKKGFAPFETAHFEQAIKQFRSRYGQGARTMTKFRGTPKVTKLTAENATVSVTYETHIEQRRDGKWRTVKTSIDDTMKLPLVHEGGRWLVDDLT